MLMASAEEVQMARRARRRGSPRARGARPRTHASSPRPYAIAGDRAIGVFGGEEIRDGERVRLFVGDIGPNPISSFHVIGEIFDRAYVEGSSDLVNRNVQSTALPESSGSRFRVGARLFRSSGIVRDAGGGGDRMATDLSVPLEDRPGALAELGEATGKAGVNVGGISCVVERGRPIAHVLVDDAGAARGAIESAGLSVSGEREVLVVDVEDRPGSLGEVARKVADAGANVELVYLATGTRVVLGADDLDKARSAL